MAETLHLAKRFFGSLRPGPPSPVDEAWAIGWLTEGEQRVWVSMSNPDRRHAVAVARAVADHWSFDGPQGPEHDRAVMAAALLHDSGKVVSGLRTPSRVVATLFWAVTDDRVAGRWLEEAPDRWFDPRRRLAQYRLHPELGADLLRRAGADSLTADWAAQHHQPEARWTVPLVAGRLLKACDDD